MIIQANRPKNSKIGTGVRRIAALVLLLLCVAASAIWLSRMKRSGGQGGRSRPFLVDASNGDAEIRNFEITGSDIFQHQIRAGLLLLMQKDPGDYLMVKRNLQRIKEGGHSGTRVGENPSTLYLTRKTALRSLTWCAGDIVHDAYHHQLYREYFDHHGAPVPVEAYSGKDAERQCIRRQALALEKLAAPATEQYWLKLQDGSHYSIPY